MSLIYRTICSCIVVAIAIFAVPAASQVQEVANQAELAKYVVGDSWKLAFKRRVNNFEQSGTVTIELKEIEGDSAWYLATAVAPNSRQPNVWWERHDTRSRSYVERREFVESAPKQRGAVSAENKDGDSYIQLPLHVGKSYKVKTGFMGGLQGYLDYVATVESLEKISTPGGVFDAYKIVYKGRWYNTKAGINDVSEQIQWFAPGARRVIKSELYSWERGTYNDRNSVELTEIKLVDKK